MTKEDNELLIKDLSARLPYGVKIELTWWVMGEGTCMNTTLEPDHIEQLLNDEYGDTEIKPYLRPMSSMTEDERKQLSEYIFSEKGRRYFTIQSNGILYSGIDNLCFIGLGDDTIDRLIDWLNEHHFDYRELIEKGLAIKATEGMYGKEGKKWSVEFNRL